MPLSFSCDNLRDYVGGCRLGYNPQAVPADSKRVFLFVFTQLCPKATRKCCRHASAKGEFNVEGPFGAIQGHVFWGQWKGDKGLNNTI